MLALSCLLRQGRFAQEASDKTLDKLLTNVSFMAGCTVNHCMLKLNQCLSWCTAWSLHEWPNRQIRLRFASFSETKPTLRKSIFDMSCNPRKVFWNWNEFKTHSRAAWCVLTLHYPMGTLRLSLCQDASGRQWETIWKTKPISSLNNRSFSTWENEVMFICPIIGDPHTELQQNYFKMNITPHLAEQQMGSWFYRDAKWRKTCVWPSR